MFVWHHCTVACHCVNLPQGCRGKMTNNPQDESEGASSMLRINNFIAGRHVAPADGQYLDNHDPATGQVSPWNLPLYLFTWKVAPALATGNTAVAKPSELTPMTAHLLTEICRDAGLPPGVLNVVHGLGGKVGAAIVGHPAVRTLSFTG